MQYILRTRLRMKQANVKLVEEARNTKDTGYAVAIGAVGQLLIEPKGLGM